jgi:putative drug exporter of the RND superfamily
MDDSSQPGPGRLARAIVWARWPIVVVWIAVLVLAVTRLPSLDNTAALSNIVPAHSPAQTAQQNVISLFHVPSSSDVVVVERRPAGLPHGVIERHVKAAVAAARAAQTRGARLLGVIPLVNSLGSSWNEHNTTVVDDLFIAPSVDPTTRIAIGQAYARQVGAPGAVTGATPAQTDQLDDISHYLLWITLATIGMIALVVTAYFRSLLAPLVTLGTAGLAYAVAIHGLAWAGQQLGVDIPGEIEPLLVVLLLGLVTDYTVFFLSHARRELRLGASAHEAAASAVARIGPSVLAAGTIVAACSCSLLIAHLQFFRALGPGLAGCALVVTAVAVTLVPAVIAIVGPRLFPGVAGDADEPDVVVVEAAPSGSVDRRPRFASLRGSIRAGREQARAEGRSAVGPVGARMLALRPVAALLAVVCLAGVGLVATVAARDARLGVELVEGLPHSSAAERAAHQASLGFTGGILSPTDVVLQGPGVGRGVAAVERLRESIARRTGVAATLGPSLQTATVQVAPGAPRVMATASGRAARIIVVFRHDPTSAATLSDFRALRSAMPALVRRAGLPAATRVGYAGQTALGTDAIAAVRADFLRIAIALAIITLALLAVFLRALVAPLLLVGSSIAGYLAALGLTMLAIHALYGSFQITYYVPLVGAVLLVALGSDYNVLVAGQIRAESARRRAREAVAVAVPQASRAITVAGVTLAGTFAMLAIIPLRPFRELALLLTIGVLVDTLVIRSVLVPSLLSLAGDRAWWPGPTRRRLPSEVLESETVGAADMRATLCVLAERIGPREASEIARRLPEDLAGALRDADRSEPFDADEFVRRVASRTGVEAPEATQTVTDVFGVLRGALPATELEYMRTSLSPDYAPLLGDVEPTPV